MNRFTIAAAALAVTAPLAACNVTTEGEAGLVRFTYEDPVATFGANLETAIAAGTLATLDVQSLDATAGIRIRAATFEHDGVAEVVGSEMNRLVIEAQAPGEVRLMLETNRGADAGRIRVAEAAWVGVKPTLPNEKVLVGGIEAMHIERRDSVGELLVGVAPAELAITPTAVAERVAGADDGFRLRYTQAGGQSFTVGDSTVVREVVTADAVAVVEFGQQIDGSSLAPGASALGIIQLQDAVGDPIGAIEGALQITSLTPAVCSAGYTAPLGLPGVGIEALAAGECVVEGRLGGHVETLTINVD